MKSRVHPRDTTEGSWRRLLLRSGRRATLPCSAQCAEQRCAWSSRSISMFNGVYLSWGVFRTSSPGALLRGGILTDRLRQQSDQMQVGPGCPRGLAILRGGWPRRFRKKPRHRWGPVPRSTKGVCHAREGPRASRGSGGSVSGAARSPPWKPCGLMLLDANTPCLSSPRWARTHCRRQSI